MTKYISNTLDLQKQSNKTPPDIGTEIPIHHTVILRHYKYTQKQGKIATIYLNKMTPRLYVDVILHGGVPE